MSVQLIVYPQGYNGVYDATTNPATDFIVNGSNFVGLDNAPAISDFSIFNVLFLQPATIPNSWYRYSYPMTPLQYPTEINGNCVIPDSAVNGFIGIYQRVTGLTAGIQYDLIIDIIPPSISNYSGNIRIFRAPNLNPAQGTFVNSIQIDETTTQLVVPVGNNATGQTYDETIFILYRRNNNDSGGCTFGQIQLQPSFGLQGSILLDDGQVICDLYEDEDLPLTLSVDEFKNVAEKPQSYSKAFNLPATKRNNRIFDHIFEITRHLDGGSPQFNPYQKTQCVLKQDGLLIFQGYLRMLDIVDKEGEISYNVNLYAEVIALADLLKDKEFNVLGFTELEHDYNITEIERSNNDGVSAGQTTPIDYINPNTSGFRTDFNTVKYPFIDWTGQLLIANGSTPNATLGNIELTKLEQAFRPCINIKYLIDRIFDQSDVPFTYTSDFFNTAEFSELFMDFNWGSDLQGAAPSRNDNLNQEFNNSGGAYYFDPTGWKKVKLQNTVSGNNALWDNTQYKFVSDVNNLVVSGDYGIVLQNTSGSSRGNSLRFSHFDSAGNDLENFYINHDSIGSGDFKGAAGSYDCIMNTGDYLQAQVQVSDSGVIKIIQNSAITFDYNNDASTVVDLLQNLRGETGQWDFLKGILTMFNLVTIPDNDNPNNIIIEPYVDTFINNRAEDLNWTDKIDISEMKLEPLTDLNRNTLFKYVEDEDDYVFQTYKEATSGFLYGSRAYDATDEFNILEGKEEIEASPFAATVVKSTFPQFSTFVTPAMYSMGDDGVSEPFDNSPRIFYNRGIEFTGTSYFIPEQNGVAEQQTQTYGSFSHLRSNIQISQYRDLNFGSQPLLPNVPNTNINNLYNLYWADYFNELYNINTRIMTIKVNLNSADINTFKFNQKVYIKNSLFRVNKIDYKPNELSTVEFILIPSSGDESVLAPA